MGKNATRLRLRAERRTEAMTLVGLIRDALAAGPLMQREIVAAVIQRRPDVGSMQVRLAISGMKSVGKLEAEFQPRPVGASTRPSLYRLRPDAPPMAVARRGSLSTSGASLVEAETALARIEAAIAEMRARRLDRADCRLAAE